MSLQPESTGKSMVKERVIVDSSSTVFVESDLDMDALDIAANVLVCTVNVEIDSI